MTALNEYDRLESTGLWRAQPGDQRREVIVSMGEATLTISDLQDRVLTHWSLAAITRANPGIIPALFHPDGDASESLELTDEQADMIDAIDRLQQVIEKRRPHPGRLRLWASLGFATTVLGAAIFWLPDALMQHTLRIVPDVKRTEISDALLAELTQVSGAPCAQRAGRAALQTLSERLTGTQGRIVILRGGIVQAAHLPDGRILLNRTLVEDWEDPEVPAGFVVAEGARIAETDPLQVLLTHAGLMESLRLLTTGDLSTGALRDHAARLLVNPGAMVPLQSLLASFAKARVPSRPYAYVLDQTGETTLPLIEGDPLTGQATDPVLQDSDWVRLQGICGA